MREIHGYTLAQVRAFMDAIERAERRRRREAVLDARAAQLQKKDFVEYLKQFDE